MKKITQKLTKSIWHSCFLAMAFLFSLTINSQDLALQGVLDLTVPGGGSNGKALHVVATADIDDLSIYGIGYANNGGGTDGEEYNFPAVSLSSGDNVLLARSAEVMGAYLAISIDQIIEVGTFLSGNGDDAVELFFNGEVIETYGDVSWDDGGSSLEWNYLDSWGYKVDGAWTYGGMNCDDNSDTTATSACPYPYTGVYTVGTAVPSDSCDYTIYLTDQYSDGWDGDAAVSILANGVVILEQATITSSEGTAVTYTFPVSEGDVITSEWTAGTYDSETAYVISDSFGNVVASVEDGAAMTEFTATCLAMFDVTFSVNTANITVGANGMYAGGGVLGDATAYAMSDDDGDGTWTVTVSLLEGTQGNYTFLNSPNDGGDWGAKENLAGQSCADANNYNDRILAEVTADTTLLHCFGSCETDGTCPSNFFDVTFSVNTANITVGANGMYAGGGVLGDATAYAMSDDDGDGTWTVTVSLLEGTQGNYTFLNSPNDGGDWGAKENLAGQSCADANNYNDRILAEVTADTTLLHCFASCETDGTCGSPAEPVLMPVDHENENVVYAWNDFGGAATTVIANPDASGVNTSATVAQSIKTAGSETWAGTFLVLDEQLDLSTITTLAVDVWTPDGGELVNLKVENAADGNINIEINQPTTVAAGWETLYYDLSGGDLSQVYDKLVFFFDFNVSGDDTAYYFDNIRLEAASTAGIDPGCNDFNDGAGDWTVVDAGGLDSDWLIEDTLANGDSGQSFGHGYLPSTAAYNDWLVSPAYNTTGLSAPTLSYYEYLNWSADATAHNVYYSLDYAGDATTATWVLLNDVIGTDAEDAWVQRTFALPSAENVVVSFQYNSTYGADWNIDDVCVQEDTLSTVDATVLDMRIYPNPSNGSYVTIQTPINGVKYVEVFDITGKRLMNTSLSADTLDVSSISSGMYLVKVTIEGQSKTSKLIIR